MISGETRPTMVSTLPSRTFVSSWVSKALASCSSVEVTEVHEELAQVLARVVGRGAHRLAVEDLERLADRAALAGEAARDPAPRQELDHVLQAA